MDINNVCVGVSVYKCKIKCVVDRHIFWVNKLLFWMRLIIEQPYTINKQYLKTSQLIASRIKKIVFP